LHTLQYGAQNQSRTGGPATLVRSSVPPPTSGAENRSASGAPGTPAAAGGDVAGDVPDNVGEDVGEDVGGDVAGDVAGSTASDGAGAAESEPEPPQAANASNPTEMIGIEITRRRRISPR
jgi:hypothetical protein